MEEEASVIRKIFELYTAKGYGIRRIARELSGENTKNLKGKEGISFNTVRGILSNPKYKGWYVGSKTQKIDYTMSTIKKLAPSEWAMYPDPKRVPPIVSEAIWEKAQHILKGRRERVGMIINIPTAGKLYVRFISAIIIGAYIVINLGIGRFGIVNNTQREGR